MQTVQPRHPHGEMMPTIKIIKKSKKYDKYSSISIKSKEVYLKKGRGELHGLHQVDFPQQSSGDAPWCSDCPTVSFLRKPSWRGGCSPQRKNTAERSAEKKPWTLVSTTLSLNTLKHSFRKSTPIWSIMFHLINKSMLYKSVKFSCNKRQFYSCVSVTGAAIVGGKSLLDMK